MNEAKTIGLVVAPGVTEKLAESLIDDIPNILSHQNNNQHDWEVDLVVDPLTGYAESVGKIFKKIQDYHDNDNGIMSLQLQIYLCFIMNEC